MRVESLIKRPMGHEVAMDGVVYAFRPPEWACEVNEPAHVARFAAIKEGYRVLPDTLALDLAGPSEAVQVVMARPAPVTRRGRQRKPADAQPPTVEVITDGDD